MKISKILILGFGSVGQGLIPVLTRELGITTQDIQVLTADHRGQWLADKLSISHRVERITVENYTTLLADYSDVDLVINVTVDVSSKDVMTWCQNNGIMYLDTCVEPWQGGYRDANVLNTTNFFLRENILKVHQEGLPTSVIAHGANPGLVTHFVKRGLVRLAQQRNLDHTKLSWAQLSERLGVRVVQIAEVDTQEADLSFDSEKFYNTWSVDGFLSELQQRAEISWGTHEIDQPRDSIMQNARGTRSLILGSRSLDTRVRSWNPEFGEVSATVVTHHETLSIAEMLTGSEYQPTVYYAYTPCPLARKSLEVMRARDIDYQDADKILLTDQIHSGRDDLGVLFYMDDGSIYWTGSSLDIKDARNKISFNTATTLQVTSSIAGAITWMQEHPTQGVVEAEDLDYEQVANISLSYLGDTLDVHQHLGFTSLQFSEFTERNT